MPTSRAAFAVYHRGVSFLVEGLSVDVPQDLLSRFPDTKLFKLATERNGLSQPKDDEPIPIDMDWLHFRYMVDYMRNRKVTFAHPRMVDKDSLRTKLDSLGFQDTSDLMVVNKGTNLRSTITHAKKHLDIRKAEHDVREAAIVNEHKAAATVTEEEEEEENEAAAKAGAKRTYKYSCLHIARFLFYEHLRTNKLEIVVPMRADMDHCKVCDFHFEHLQAIHTCIYNGDYDYYREDIEDLIDICEEDRELQQYHQDCMMLYGLEYKKIRSIGNDGDIMVHLTKSWKAK